MTFNQDEYKSVVGVDKLYIALVQQDDENGYEAGTPEYLAPAAEVSAKPKTDQTTQYADNMAFDVLTSEGETDLEVTITNLPAAMAAKLLGKPFDAATGRVVDMPGAVPPYFALGFRSMKSNGKKRHFWYQKVQFSAPEESIKTVEDKKTPQTVKLVAKALMTVHEWTVNGVTGGIKRIYGDEDTDAFSASGWFTQVQIPEGVMPAVLTLLSSVPINNATGVARAAGSFTLTFNNKLQASEVYGVTLLDATPVLVETTATLDATKKILTVSHAVQLAATTAHTLVIAVTDIYGQTLNQLVKFTTGS